MRCSANASILLLFLTAWLTLPVAGHCAEYGVVINNARLFEQHRSYALEADIVYNLPPKVLETVQNGIPLQWVLRVQVSKPRRYLWDELLAEVLQRYSIRYHALRNIYQIKDENRGDTYTFSSLPSALAALGTIRGLPIAGLQMPSPDDSYFVRIKMQMDREALPLPMRPPAYFDSDWNLSSGWYSWSVQK